MEGPKNISQNNLRENLEKELKDIIENPKNSADCYRLMFPEFDLCYFLFFRTKEQTNSRRFACPLSGNVYRVGCVRRTS